MVSGTISLPSSGCFSPFPHGTRTLSVSREYLALPDGPGGFTQGSTCPALLRIPVCPATLRLRSCHPLRRRFPAASPRVASAIARSYYPGGATRTGPGLGCSPFARHYWGNHCCFLFLEVLRCFSSLRSPPHTMVRVTALQAAGLSHSETRGSQVICTSPRIIAAYRVLHRLREPRHPPCALACFPRNRGPTSAGMAEGSRGAHTFSCVEMFNVLRSRQFHLTTVLLVQHVKDRRGNRFREVENNGFEPLTPCLQSRCSSQLS